MGKSKSQYILMIKYVIDVAVKHEVFEICQKSHRNGNHACYHRKTKC